MNQDTRKDPRAKVLTMTVRYKSATLDEFIEHHSYDVSRGGMFIKTPSPFPPGTLLKFEVKIADEQRLMQGVGRVVWKREANDSNDARPAGMGVKFIKIDDESRRTIERLVDARGGDGDNAFDQGNAPRAPVASPPTSSTAPTKPLEQPPAAAARSRKSTVIGLGAMKPSGISGSSQRAVTISSGPPRTVTPSPPQAQEKPAETFFPKTDSRAGMPPVEDQTMMKQAKELLADAMRYAGGTAEDVKAAAKASSIPPHIPRPEPHKSVPPRPTAKVEVPRKSSPFQEQSEEGEAATTIWRATEAAALLAESMKDSEPPPQGEEIHGRITARPPAEAAEPEPRFRDSEPATTPGTSTEEERGSAGKVAVAPPLPTKLKPEHVEDEAPASEPPKPAAKPAAAKAPVSVSERPSSRTRASQAMMEAANEAASEGGGGGKGVFALLALAAAAGIGFYLTRPPAAAPEPPPAPVEVAKPAPTPEPTPVATAPETPPSAAVSAAPAESASAAPPSSASAEAPKAPEPPAGAAPAKPEPEVAEKPTKPAPRRVVVPRRAPVKKKAEPVLSGEESETPPAEAAPKPPADAAPEAPPPTPAPQTPTPPSPTPPPATKPLGDNPY
jgi:uncharacterized protein (TIGR02266 family)